MNNKPVLELSVIEKEFPGVKALKGVDFSVERNEIVGLVGENGAGKSTLMKILIGLYSIDGGIMKVRGEETQFKDPLDAIKHGVGMVFQEQSLISNLTVAENIVFCHEDNYKLGPFLKRREILKEAETQLKKCGFRVDPTQIIRDISQAQRQLVEIARLMWLSKVYGISDPVLILDEPTTVLVQSEINQLFDMLRRLEDGASIIFISHRLEEILALTDRIVVLKDGENVSTMKTSDATLEKIENLMVGHELAADHYKVNEQVPFGSEVILEVKELYKKGIFDPISFKLHEGEILCLGGVIGSGKEDLCKCITGINTSDGGEIYSKGKKVEINKPTDSIKAGIGYIPADRRDEGLGLQMDVKANITLIMLRSIITNGILLPRKEEAVAQEWVERLHIKTPSLKSFVGTLSGGNQQKVVLAKWLASRVKVLILDHPTRGVDVGAKEEIYNRIRELAKEGVAMIIMCDTMEEDIGLSDRMITLRDGKVTAEIECPADNKPAPVDIIGYMV